MKKTIVFASILIAFTLGAGAMWIYQRQHQPEVSPVASTDFLNGVFDNDFFRHSNDPFQEMDRMRKRMDKLFGDDRFSSNFDTWFDHRFGQFGASSIEQGEDQNSVYYKMNVGDKDLVDLKVNVSDGYVSIDAKLKNESANSFSQSSVSQRFPVPAGVDPNSAKIEKQDGTVIIRFDKVS